MSNQTLNVTVNEAWKYGILGTGIGLSGLITVDIDNDGIVEVIAGGSTSTFGANQFWSILEYSPVTQLYDTKFISSLYTENVSKVAVFDLDNDGIYSIFVGLSNGDIEVYNGSDLQQIASINSPANSINQILFADADNDGSEDIVIIDNNNLFIYNPNTLALEHQINYGGSDFEIGNVDADSANEIVFANGIVLELNGQNSKVEWDYNGGDFGYLVELSDIDTDGKKEIVGASRWNYITAFDADIKSPKGQINTPLDIDALLVQDIDNDGKEEILYGDGQWGNINAYDAESLTQKWKIRNPDHGVTNIAVFDTDGDGQLEVLWGAGASSTGADYLHIHEIPSLEKEWQSQHLDGPFHAIDVGDIDGDGEQEIVFASFESNSGYDDGIISIYNAQTFELEWQNSENLFAGHAWTGVHDLKIGDVDNDGVQEIVIATDKLYDGAIYVLNGQTKEIEESYIYDDGAPIFSVEIADIDNDGETEIIAGGSRAHTGAPGVYTYIINGSTGEVEWNSINLGNSWSQISDIKVGNVDNDSTSEIVAINNHVFVFDGITHQQKQSSLTGINSLDLYDLDNNGIEEIVVGTDDGKIIFLDGQNLQQLESIDINSSPIVGLKAYDIDGNGTPELIFASNGHVGIYNLEQYRVIWESEKLGTSVGDYGSLVVSNIDSDDKLELLVGTNYTVNLLEIDFDVITNNIINKTDFEALVALYNSTGGDNWTNNTGWNISTNNNVGDWYGVTVQNNRVVNINLRNNNLTGNLPTELGNLTALRTLNLQSNELTGNLPTELGNLTALQTLNLQNNNLSGNLPTEIGNLTALRTLNLQNNELTGNIPTEIGDIQNLQSLQLQNNLLTGTIPDSINNRTWRRLNLENQPFVSQTIKNQEIAINTAANIDISNNFADLNNDTITYTATGLPIGLTIDTNTGIISGEITAYGNFNITITGTDNDGSIDTNFVITIPRLVGEWDPIRSINAVKIVDNYAYVVGDQLEIIDISDPNNLKVIGNYNDFEPIDSGENFWSGLVISSIDVVGNYAYFLVRGLGLQIMDISNPSNPTLITTYETSDGVRDVEIVDNYAYLAGGSSGIQIIDISDPTTPTLIGNYDAVGYANDVEVLLEFRLKAQNDSEKLSVKKGK